MAYSDFTLRKAKDELHLTFIEGDRFFPEITPVLPSGAIAEFLRESIPLAVATGSEKARSELIISPLLLELRRTLNHRVSIFSGEVFDVDFELGLNGVCDFLISRSSEQMLIEAPVVVVVEAKKGDLKQGLGQCIAEMSAAQRFNQQKALPIEAIYGSVSNGTSWRFLKLVGDTVTADLTEYPLLPVEQILGILVWMTDQG